jgi:O-antigen/teichoic acid export membrane protein
MSFTPLLLSTMSKMVGNGEHEHARILSRDAIRLVLGMVPFAAMASGASHEVVLLIFGANFAAAGPLLAWLIFGQVAGAMIAVAFVVLIVAQRPGWSTVIAGPMLALALAGHYLLVPRFGSIGAAWVTTTLEIVGALGALWIVYRVRRVLPPLATVIRTVLIASAAWLAAASWPTDGMGLVVKLGLISIGIAAGYWFMREFKPTELAWARAMVRRVWP